MLIDHLVVDRSYGGRFQPKDGWAYVTAKGPLEAWDRAVDTRPETKEHKPFIRESAAAAAATCLQCKSQDHILHWRFMGERSTTASLSQKTREGGVRIRELVESWLYRRSGGQRCVRG